MIVAAAALTAVPFMQKLTAVGYCQIYTKLEVESYGEF